MPGSDAYAGIEFQMISIMNREYFMKKYVDMLRNDYDYVIIDCPPNIGMLTINALVATDELLIPAQPQEYSATSVHQILNTVEMVWQFPNPQLKIGGIFLTMFDSNKQREWVLPSEKAKSLQMKMEAMSRQGQRTDLSNEKGGPVVHKLKSRDIVAQDEELSGRQISRYLPDYGANYYFRIRTYKTVNGETYCSNSYSKTMSKYIDGGNNTEHTKISVNPKVSTYGYEKKGGKKQVAWHISKVTIKNDTNYTYVEGKDYDLSRPNGWDTSVPGKYTIRIYDRHYDTGKHIGFSLYLSIFIILH